MAFSRYNVPDYWSVGEVYKRLIKDISNEYADNLIEIYSFLLLIPEIYFRMLSARQNLHINNIERAPPPALSRKECFLLRSIWFVSPK